MKDKISIVTVVYNGEKYLEKTILSVINQDYKNIEYIVVDGGSTDNTLQILEKFKSKIGHYYRIHFLSSFKRQIQYFKKIDRFIVVNDLQAGILVKYFKVDLNKIDIIPNIVEDDYFQSNKFDFKKKYNFQNYILCTGNISKRKNQLNLAIACAKLNVNLVLIGNVLDGEFEYGRKLEKLVKKSTNILWLKEIQKASSDLISAYYNCDFFVLPSLDETQPISALEAVAMKKKIILLDRSYAKQKYYSGAILCRSSSVEDIMVSIIKCKENETIPNYESIVSCTEKNVGLSYKKAYLKTVSNKHLTETILVK
jgi:glycosyltransferase involved in cell wall biosynthesis